MDKKVPVVRFKGFTDDWEQVKLGKTVKREKSYPLTRSAETNDNTNYRYIHYGDIHTGRATIINQASDLPKIKQSDYLTLKSGDIIVADASEDYKGIADAALLTSTFGENIVAGLHTIAMSPINTSSLFLYYKFQTSDFKKYGRKTGTGLKVFGISSNNLLKYSFFTPSETEQERIGKLLFILEKTITLYQQQLGMLDKLKQSLLQQLFPKENSKTPKVRFSGFTEEWEQVQLSSVVSFINGKAFKQSELLNNGKYKVVRVGNFNTNGQWYYSNLELPKDKYISKGDLVYLWATNFGPEIWNGGKAIFHYHIWKLIFNEKSIDKGYLFYWLYMDKSKVLADTNGTTMIHITKGNMEERILDKPTKFLEQKKVGLMLTKVDSLIDLYQLKIERNKKTKNMLLQNLFV